MRKEFINIKLEERVSTNKIYGGVHWNKRQKYAEYFHGLIEENIKEIHPFEKFVDLRFDFFFEKRPYDSSNCSFMGKMLEDGLASNKDIDGKDKVPFIKCDDISFVGDITYRSHRADKGKGDYVIITIVGE